MMSTKTKTAPLSSYRDHSNYRMRDWGYIGPCFWGQGLFSQTDWTDFPQSPLLPDCSPYFLFHCGLHC